MYIRKYNYSYIYVILYNVYIRLKGSWRLKKKRMWRNSEEEEDGREAPWPARSMQVSLKASQESRGLV